MHHPRMLFRPANEIRRTNFARHLPSTIVPMIAGSLWFLLSGTQVCADQFAKRNNDGNRLAQQGRYDEALSAYESARIERPDAPGVIYNIGNVYHLKAAFDSAAAILQDALAHHDNPVSAETAYNLGNTLYRMNEYQKAVEAYKRALRQNPNDLDAKHNLELALRHLDRRDSTPKQQQNQPDSSQQDQNQEKEQQPKQDSTQNQQQKQDSSAAGQQPDRPPSDQERQQQMEQPSKGMTREDAERLLDALKNDELKLQRLRAQRIVEENVVKDW